MEDNIGTMLAEVSRMIRRAFNERAREIGVTRPQWLVLTTLRRHEGIKQGGLAEILDIEPITLCRILDRLQDAALVERRKDPSDRRAWRLFLTDKAQALLEQLKPLGAEVMELALGDISQQDCDQLRATLSQIHRNLARRPQGENPADGNDDTPSTPLSEY